MRAPAGKLMLTCDRKYKEEGLTGFGMVMVNILGLKALLLVLLGIKQIARAFKWPGFSFCLLVSH